jgi:3-oxoacyl-[acyl-carrier protein] reductase
VLRDEGGSIVVVLPTMVLTGAPQAVGWVTAAEGYRGLAKAAARSWGRDGIRVNCVCAPTRSFGVPAADRDGLQPPARADEVGLRNGLAPAVAGLLSNGFGPVTGQTIAVDGGVWMTP